MALPQVSGVSVKKRPLPYKGFTKGRIEYGTSNSPVVNRDVGNIPSTWAQGIQVTESENHPSWRGRLYDNSFKGDIGGNFLSQRRYAYSSQMEDSVLEGKKVVVPGLYTWAKYVGPMLPWYTEPAPFPPYILSSNSTLESWGTTAIARCKPTNSVADFSTFLGELLREGIPSMIGSSVERWRNGTIKARKAPANEFLNAQFGWLPIANDVGKFINAVGHAEEVYNQFLRDAGRLVRRRYEFPTETERTIELVASDRSPKIFASHSALYDDATFNKGKVSKVRETYRRRWFSGAFTYHLPEALMPGNPVTTSLPYLRKVYGVELSPELIWNLAPWSWAVDWVSNVGDVASNLSDWMSDGLVLRYGYIMEHTMVKDTYIFTGPTGFQSGSATCPTLTLVSESKMRRKATPFGFGLTWGGLSPTQLAIAAALGISKS